MEKYSQVIFDKNTVEFVTVAAEYCGFLERARDMKRYDFVDTALKILPLLYLKATLHLLENQKLLISIRWIVRKSLLLCEKLWRIPKNHASVWML